MTAVRTTGEGGPASLCVGPEPVPVPGAGEVLVRVAAAGLNRADLMQAAGTYPPPPGESEVLGLEVSGIVVAHGPGTDPEAAGADPRAVFALGDRVCALLAGGGYAEYAAVPLGQLMRVPDEVDLVEAAAFPEVACTVWSNLGDRACVGPGDRVLVHGGTGGIGSFAVQYLAAVGARVIATVGSTEKAERARILGAEATIDHTRAVTADGEPDFASVVRQLTDGAGVDAVLDVVGGPYLAQNVAALAPEGRIVTIAVQGGAKADSFNMMRLVAKRGWLTGSTLRSRPREEKARIVAQTAKAVLPLVADGRIDLAVSARFALADAAAAHERFDSAERTGKVLLVTDPARADAGPRAGGAR